MDFSSGINALAFTHLSTASALASHYSASVLLFLSLPCLASQLASQVLRRFFRRFGISSIFPPGFPCFFPDSKYSAFCLFPFALPCFAPTVVSQVLAFALTPAFSIASACLSSASTLGFGYLASVSSFSDFPRLASQWLLRYNRLRFRFPGLAVRHAWFPMHSNQLVSTRLPVCFLSSFPASLPRLFHRCSPFGLPPTFSLASAFFRPLPL